MLQWMGGSRRKVTATRKSTQKRQKQYFEQRKRQQLQQQTTGLETSDGVTTCSQFQTNNQSLDILSLLNLSTVVQNYKSSCHSARENSDDSCMTKNHHITNFPPTIPSYKASPADPIASKEARNPLGSEVDTDTVCRKMVLSSAPDIQNRDLIGNSDKMDQLKMTSERQLSVFDLVAHDGPNDNLAGSPEHEAHVAFAVEGLGKVEIETPAHSPQTPGRIFSYGSSSPLKASRQPQSSKNLNNLVYDLELDVGAVVQDNDSDSFLDLPFCSRGIANSFNKRRQKLFTAKDCSRFNSNAYQLKNHFAGDEIFYNIEDENDDIWNDGNFLDENCDITWKNRPLNLDGNSADYWNVGNHELSDFDIEGHYMKKIRVTEKATGRFNISEPPALYSKQRRSEGDHDFRTPYGTWYPTLERNCDFRDATNHPAWSCYVTEDAGESLSLSEESCSSSAVRGKATKSSPSNSAARQNTRRHGGDIRSPVNTSSVENVYAKYRNYAKSDDRHERKRINGPGKFTKTWNPPSSNPNHFPNHIFPKNLGPEDSFLFEEGYISADRDSGFGSFFQTPGAKQRALTDAKLWIEDPFGSYLLPEVHSNVKSSFQRPKHDFLHEFSPPVSFSSEKVAFCRPHSQANSCGTPIFSTIGCGRCKPNLFVDPKVEDKLRDLFPAVGSQGDAEFLHVSVEESVAKYAENRSDIQPTDFLKFKLQKDGCIGSNDLSSENGEPLEESDSKDNCSDFKEAKDLTPELENEKATGSPEHAEATSSSVKIPEKIEHSTDEKEYHNDDQVSLRQKNENTEIDDSGPKERKLDSKVQTNSLDPSYDVMMLESFVLQLLCVQKVLKEPSGNHTVKKLRFSGSSSFGISLPLCCNVGQHLVVCC